MYFMGMHIGATWRIRRNNLSGVGNAVCRYNYRRNLTDFYFYWAPVSGLVRCPAVIAHCMNAVVNLQLANKFVD